MTDIVEHFRTIAIVSRELEDPGLAAEFDAAADEIERLRALITEWADAEDAYSRAAQWRDWDTIGEDQQRFEAAENALRQAVGR